VLLEIIRYSVFALFVGAAAVAAGGWAVRTRRVSPFSPLGRTLRNATDPILKPIEYRLVRSGGNPVNAGWWLFGMSLAQWIVGQLSRVSYAARGGGLLRLIVSYAVQVLQLAIIIRVIGSWMGVGRYNRWMRPVYLLTDWILEPLRRIIPPFAMGDMAIDLSPLVALLLLWYVVPRLMALL